MNATTHARLETLRARFAELKADALLVTQPANVRYLSNFSSPNDGRVLITQEGALLITDGRYITQANGESALEVVFCERSTQWLEVTLEQVGQRTLAVEADNMTLATYRAIAEKLGREPVASEGLVAALRLTKTPQEIATLREAARLTDAAFEHILGFIRAGRQEVEVALELERFIRAQGAKASFETVVASGVRSSMPHGVASNKVIEAGDLVTLDFGAQVEGYHADMTRTIGVGRVTDASRRLYALVLEAQEAALGAIGPGKEGQEVDNLVRRIFAREGLEERFSHSLGHGVGLAVHEGPRLSKHVSEKLEPGMAVTVEPGLYIPGEAGVRIEDLIVITDNITDSTTGSTTGSGYDRLSHSPKGWIEV